MVFGLFGEKWWLGYVFELCVWVSFEQGSGAVELRVDLVVHG